MYVLKVNLVDFLNIILKDDILDAHIQICEITWPIMLNDNTKFVLAFMVNESNMYAFCNIGTTFNVLR